MSSLSLIQKLASHSTQQTADFAHDRCLRKRLAGFECTECIDVCKSGAISIGDSGVSFEASACSGCMLCAKACPNDAFVFSEFDAGSLCFAEDKTEFVVISCHKQSQIYPEERLVPCLGGIATEHLLALNMSGKSAL
ncbi:MAG: 4Fe-4S dicluster domain-containing protein, partial [Desulfocapsaceae bacterium]